MNGDSEQYWKSGNSTLVLSNLAVSCVRMGDLSPIAFDIETDGLEPGSVLTVAGLTTEMGSWLALNTTGRDADAKRLATAS